jgi:hypothetical protein
MRRGGRDTFQPQQGHAARLSQARRTHGRPECRVRQVRGAETSNEPSAAVMARLAVTSSAPSSVLLNTRFWHTWRSRS